jgi:hypothetical protein
LLLSRSITIARSPSFQWSGGKRAVRNYLSSAAFPPLDPRSVDAQFEKAMVYCTDGSWMCSTHALLIVF